VSPEVLDACWKKVTADSFGRVTVDGDTSTNDAAVVLASGAAGNTEMSSTGDLGYETFYQTLLDVCTELAQAIIRDGEGATKFISVIVEGGETEEDCIAVAQTVALSPLVKTAFFASDPNWGRILAAVGRAPISRLEIDKVDLYLGEVRVATGGSIDASYTETAGKAEMQKSEIDIRIVLNAGKAKATVWTCDLSHEYVRINAEYRS
jgi:glutamate N-acetyltransferase/amino-acid N-acetyltransferase